MTKIDLTQNDVDNHLATTDEFWETFQKSLKAPFSIWNEYKEKTKEQWAQKLKYDNDFVGYLNIIFDNTPVLKGEFPVCYSNDTGLILTNYRLFYNGNTGLVIIPLKDLLFYGKRVEKGKGWLEDDDEKFLIEYNKNGETLSVELHQWMLPEYVENTKNAGEFRELDDVSHSLLSMTFYDFEKKDLNVPKIEYLATVKTMNLKKWITEIKDSVSEIGKFLSNTNKEELIGTIKNFHYLTFVGVGLILISLLVGWWLMVPITLASFFLFSQRKNMSSGVEKQVSILGTWAIIGLFVLRTLFLMGGGANEQEEVVFHLPSPLVESQVSFLKELDRRITDFYKRKDSVNKKINSEKNPHRNPGVDWKEYHDFLYEQIKWLSNTSYNTFYKSNIEEWKAKITEIGIYKKDGAYDVISTVGVYGNPKRDILLILRVSSSNLLGQIDVGSWVQFSGSWDTSPREGREWMFKDSKPILGEYVRFGIAGGGGPYGLWFDYDDNPVEPKDYVFYTEKDVGQISENLSNVAKIPDQTGWAESLLEDIYSSVQYMFHFKNNDQVVFIIKVKSLVTL